MSPGAILGSSMPLVVAVASLVLLAVRRAQERDAQRVRERLAGLILAPAPAPAATVRRAAEPAVRPKPAPSPARRPVATPAARARVPGRGGGPAWAANAIVAAEVFGPPVAMRRGDTLGPPPAL